MNEKFSFADIRADLFLAVINLLLGISLAAKPEVANIGVLSRWLNIEPNIIAFTMAMILFVAAGVIFSFQPPGQYYRWASLPTVMFLTLETLLSFFDDSISLATAAVSFIALIYVYRDFEFNRRVKEAELALKALQEQMKDGTTTRS